MIVDDLGRIPMSSSLASSLARAAGYAEAQLHREVTLEHLLLALTEDADAGQILTASHIDLARVVTDVSGMLGRIEEHNAPEQASRVTVSADLKRILEAAAAASRGRRREINGAIVLAAIVGDGRTPAAHILRSQGLTFEEAIRVLQRAMAQPQSPPTPSEPPAPPPQAYVTPLPQQASAAPDPLPLPAHEPMASVPQPAFDNSHSVQADPASPVTPLTADPPAVAYAPPAAVTEDLLAGARARVNRSRVEAPRLPEPGPAPELGSELGPEPTLQPAPSATSIAEDEMAAVEAANAGYGYERYTPSAVADPMHQEVAIEVAAASGYDVTGYVDQPPLVPHYADPVPHQRVPLDGSVQSLPVHYEVAPVPVQEAPLSPPSWMPPPLPRPALRVPAAPPPLPRDGRGPRSGGTPQRPVTPGASYPPPPPSFREPQVPPNPIYPPWPPVDMPPPLAQAAQSLPPQQADVVEFAAPAPQIGQHVPGAYEPIGDADYGQLGAAPWPVPAPLPAPDFQSNIEAHGRPLAEPSFEAMPRPQVASSGYGPGVPSPILPSPMLPASLDDAAEHDQALGQHAASPAATASPARGDRRTGHVGGIEVGQLLENIPRAMRLAVPVVVEVRIAKADVKVLAEGMSGEGRTYQHEIVVTKAMSVRLRAPEGGFYIETTSPETQWLENTLGLMADDYASWRWTVTPRHRGRHRLQLVVAARTVGRDGLTAETALPEQVIDVRVKTNYGLTARRWGGWIAAAVVGGVLQRFSDSLVAFGAKLATLLAAG